MNSAVNYGLMTKFITQFLSSTSFPLLSKHVFLVSVVDKSSGEGYCSIYCIDLVQINNNNNVEVFLCKKITA